MSSRKFKFVSPGVFLKEVDNSQIPSTPGGIGPVIIGRTRKGPAMKPVKVDSYNDFVRIFGSPVPGGERDDVWRDGNGLLATAYAPYAAEAYLKAKGDLDSPVTMVRLLGVSGPDASDAGEPGWQAHNPVGIFMTHRTATTAHTASLVGIIYGAVSGEYFEVGFSGRNLATTASSAGKQADVGTFVRAATDDGKFTMVISSSLGGLEQTKTISFDSGGEDWIRKQLNTNPVATNTNIMSADSLSKSYWLGETFEEKYKELVRKHGVADLAIATAKLTTTMADFKTTSHEMQPARSGWVFPQHAGSSADFDPTTAQKLFRFISLQEGEQGDNIIIKIENIKISESDLNPYGTFDVVIYESTPSGLDLKENWPGCNLNPNSDKFIARQIGDQYFSYSKTEKRNRVYGTNPNASEFVRMEMGSDVGDSGPRQKSSVPFGYFGPVIPADEKESMSSGTATFNTWVADALIFNSSSTAEIRIEYPSPQTLITASIPNGPGQKPYLGVTPFIKTHTAAGEEEGTSIDRGYKEYLRCMPNYSTLLADQIAGTTTSATKHAYAFSLDDVFLDPNAGQSLSDTDMSEVSLNRILHIPGSHKGIGAVTGTVATSATAAIVFTRPSFASATASMPTIQHFDEFTIGDGVNSVTFCYHSGTTLNAGNYNELQQLEVNGKFVVIFSGSQCLAAPAVDVNNLATNLASAINFCDGLGGAPLLNTTATTAATASAAPYLKKWKALDQSTAVGIISAVTAKAVRLTQPAGALGNTTISSTIQSGSTAQTSSPGLHISSSFIGGANAIDTTAAINSYTKTNPAKILVRDVIDGFTMPMAGGFDGVNITEADPFNNSTRTLSGKTTRTSYAYASVDRALNIIKDAESMEYNLAAMPGITNATLTRQLVDNCEARGDSMAIIDLPDVYIPPHELSKTNFQSRLATNPTKAAKALRDRQLNSSYGATYYPWVKIGAGDNLVWVPPSVVALGVMAYTEKVNDVWFAPAGFNRGGLNRTTAGVPVLGVTEQLLSKDRDTLYESNINPIASFVTEGIVIFGQKTLQETPSALDRINVRRLLIFTKRLVSRISNSLIFDQNLPATWNRFKGRVIPELEAIKTRLGLADFKVILDETTTTPDLVDRNIMYAKIFLKPARAIEFIAVDFVITNSGASFDD